MKRFFKILLILFTLLTSFQTNAQIRKTLMGLTLGVSSEQAVFNKLGSLGFSIGFEPQRHYSDNVEYAGYKWSKTTFYYHNKILYKIEFHCPRIPSEEGWSNKKFTPASDILRTIYNNLSNKYSNYNKGGYFSDGKTRIRIDWEKCLMIYENISIAEKVSKASIDDL